jgi:hypothetical protein
VGKPAPSSVFKKVCKLPILASSLVQLWWWGRTQAWKEDIDTKPNFPSQVGFLEYDITACAIQTK